jgi:hypothetical protein
MTPFVLAISRSAELFEMRAGNKRANFLVAIAALRVAVCFGRPDS